LTNFFSVLYWREHHKLFSKHTPHIFHFFPSRILVSAGNLWNKKSFGNPAFPPHTMYDELFIDSGGFQFFGKFGEYPYSVRDYLDFIEMVRPEMYAAMDYPCEPEICKKNKVTVKQNIDRTIEKLILTKNSCVGAGKMIPVIQGWEVDESRQQNQGSNNDYTEGTS
jgi:hypothetical protein